MYEVIGRANNTGMASVEETAGIAEVQAKMILARNFPRDLARARAYIAMECTNVELAEMATYVYKRGNTEVKGPSIRLVECVARYWGNISSGIKEIASDGKKATVKAYCWDLETNFADEKVFDVPYVRETKSGGVVPVTSERDKYEIMANMAARRKRACIQAVIPKSIIDEAMRLCEETLEKSMKEKGIEETKAKMLSAFQGKADWITEEHFENLCQKPYDTLNAKDIVKLRNIYTAIVDGYVKVEAVFSRTEESDVADEDAADALNAVNSIVGDIDNGINKG